MKSGLQAVGYLSRVGRGYRSIMRRHKRLMRPDLSSGISTVRRRVQLAQSQDGGWFPDGLAGIPEGLLGELGGLLGRV